MTTKTQTYLLSAALVGSLGLNAAQLGAIGEARASIEEVKVLDVMVEITPAQFASATGLEIAQYVCDKTDQKYGLEGEHACTLADIEKIVAVFSDAYETGAALFGHSKKVGSWTAGAPE